MHNPESTRTTLNRWRTARRAVLGAIVLAGTVVTSAAVMYDAGSRNCDGYHRAVDRSSYQYNGIGVVIERHRGEVVVRRVLAGSPAEGTLRPGMRLITVDGVVPPTLDGWASAIRGEPGTTVQIETAYRPCPNSRVRHRVFELERAVVHLSY